ncbi:MAG TPA: antibiotic biosynthesis monooxygenase [Terriglobales bacterium]|nr:antibiotic biosynthesis monooxygenase [Terriglobales bacterium]
MYVVVWEFIVRAECKDEFEAIYGPQGEWARLFRRGDGYERTDLLHDRSGALRYITLDFWRSCEAYERFQREHRAEYQALDERCGHLTVKETRIGQFEVVP